MTSQNLLETFMNYLFRKAFKVLRAKAICQTLRGLSWFQQSKCCVTIITKCKDCAYCYYHSFEK